LTQTLRPINLKPHDASHLTGHLATGTDLFTLPDLR
jgi:hypothetical protein